jgi:hypothetical protein
MLILILEEAENVTAIISEWLELDSPDDWIRNDAEIVRFCFVKSWGDL